MRCTNRGRRLLPKILQNTEVARTLEQFWCAGSSIRLLNVKGDIFRCKDSIFSGKIQIETSIHHNIQPKVENWFQTSLKNAEVEDFIKSLSLSTNFMVRLKKKPKTNSEHSSYTVPFFTQRRVWLFSLVLLLRFMVVMTPEILFTLAYE